MSQSHNVKFIFYQSWYILPTTWCHLFLFHIYTYYTSTAQQILPSHTNFQIFLIN